MLLSLSHHRQTPTYAQVSCTTNKSATARQQRPPDDTTASRTPYANNLYQEPESLPTLPRISGVYRASKTRQIYVEDTSEPVEDTIIDISKTRHRHVTDMPKTRPRHVKDTSQTRLQSKTSQRHVKDTLKTRQRSTEKTRQRSTELVLLSVFCPAPALLSPKNASSACPSSSTPQEVSAAS